jgi:hypothetical protein
MKDFLESINDSAVLDCSEFLEQLESVLGENVPPVDSKALCVFVAKQYGRWDARYMFSQAAKPDIEARAQADAWYGAMEHFRDLLSEAVPEVQHELSNTLRMISLEPTLAAQMEWNETHAWSKFLAYPYEGLARFFQIISIRSIALYFKSRQMYPPGTVGRS